MWGGRVVSMSWFEDTTNTSQIYYSRKESIFCNFSCDPKKNFQGISKCRYTFFGSFDPSYEKKIF